MYYNIMYGNAVVVGNVCYGHVWRNEELSGIYWNSRAEAENACKDMMNNSRWRYWVEEVVD